MMLGLLALCVGSVPNLITSSDLEPQAQLREEATRAWQRYEAVFLKVTHVTPRAFSGTLVMRKGELARDRSGESRPGEVWLRQTKPFQLSALELTALRHELAHQFLFAACPQASNDKLFHESFALSLSGELEAWTDDEYRSLSWALGELSQQTMSLDSRNGRRALARLLVESLTPEAALPLRLVVPLRRCADGANWQPLEPHVLAAGAEREPSSATVIIHRISGEIVFSEGEVGKKLPYGSTLKPFVAAGSRSAPVLPQRQTTEWSCGENVPPMLGVAKALSHSCNGYFLDWAAQSPQVAQLGAWGPVLVAAGLPRVPADISEALGLRATLTLSPLGLARAYRLLAAARPEVMEFLRDTAREGTLSGLDVSKSLEGLALKTGTVRDAQSRPLYGWVVGVSDTLVAVMVQSDQMPRKFATQFWKTFERVSRSSGESLANVQVFGLLDSVTVKAKCQGAGFVLNNETPQLLPQGEFCLQHETGKGRVMCLEGAFNVKFPGIKPDEGREYAGIFEFSPTRPYRVPVGAQLSEKTKRARQGSMFVFETTRSLYAGGVIQAEDSTIQGEARAALLKVIDANGQHKRHGDRPVCDTTHCQVFQGTRALRPSDSAALAQPLQTAQWLPFSKGGQQAWREERSLRKVEEVLKGSFTALEFSNGQVTATRTREQGESIWDDAVHSSCEAFRGALKLPSCPSAARRVGTQIEFEGTGQGHGLGLDVEWAKSSGLKVDELLRRAYGDVIYGNDSSRRDLELP